MLVNAHPEDKVTRGCDPIGWQELRSNTEKPSAEAGAKTDGPFPAGRPSFLCSLLSIRIGLNAIDPGVGAQRRRGRALTPFNHSK